jgi:hypothetical protein
MIVDSKAHKKVLDELLREEVHIKEVFGLLGLGWSLWDVQTYLEDTPTWEALSEELKGKVLGMVCAFACVAVERDRELGNGGLR